VAYFHRAHYNSPMALAAYFYRYPASRGISRAVSKVSESSTGSAACTDQMTWRPRLVFSRQPLWCVSSAVILSNGRIDLSAHPIPKVCQINELLLYTSVPYFLMQEKRMLKVRLLTLPNGQHSLHQRCCQVFCCVLYILTCSTLCYSYEVLKYDMHPVFLLRNF
jgi:hypothetical protein